MGRLVLGKLDFVKQARWVDVFSGIFQILFSHSISSFGFLAMSLLESRRVEETSRSVLLACSREASLSRDS